MRDGREWVARRGRRRNDSIVGDAPQGNGRGGGRLDVERRLGRENNKNKRHLI